MSAKSESPLLPSSHTLKNRSNRINYSSIKASLTLFLACVLIFIFFGNLVYLESEGVSRDPKVLLELIASTRLFRPSPLKGRCTIPQAEEGMWVQRRNPLTTFEEVKMAYGMPPNTPNATAMCATAPPLFNDTLSRTLEITNWEWEPSSQCQIFQWSPMKTAVRFLRSPNGFFSVGGDKFRYKTLSLNLTHPETPAILKLAGVDESRLASPLAVFSRHHHLLSKEEVDSVFSGIEGHAMEGRIQETDWFPLYTEQKALHLNQQKIAWDALPIEKRISEKEKKRREEKDIITMQVGSHWNTAELGKGLSNEGLFGSYRNMVEFVKQRVEDISPPVTAIWRTLGPGHVDCEQYQAAENDRTINNSTKNPLRMQHNWHMLAGFNDILKDVLLRDDATGFIGEKSNSKMRWGLVDVWDMSMKRPDAHVIGAQGDCFHFCIPGVMTGWHDFLWNAIVQDSRYPADYV